MNKYVKLFMRLNGRPNRDSYVLAIRSRPSTPSEQRRAAKRVPVTTPKDNAAHKSAGTNALSGLGRDIRELRKSRQMTVRDLAAAIDRSIGFVSQIEREISSPSLKDLYTIASALGVHVGWFLEKPDPPYSSEQGLIVRAENRRWMESEGIRTEILSPRLGDRVEFMQATFAPGARTEPTSVKQPGIETALILSGQLEMWIDGQIFLLKAGDSYSVRLDQEFWSRNPSDDQKAVLIWTVSYA